ncbi:hypothetical protein STEG23_025193, partial [Scotinomys teguina]
MDRKPKPFLQHTLDPGQPSVCGSQPRVILNYWSPCLHVQSAARMALISSMVIDYLSEWLVWLAPPLKKVTKFDSIVKRIEERKKTACL